MITVLLLTAVEKLVNLALRSDKVTQAGLAPLSGKMLRVGVKAPEFNIDIIFNDDHIRFEPVTTANSGVFEPQGMPSADSRHSDADYARQEQAAVGHVIPDCTIKVDNFADLLNLMRAPEGNLPIQGDYKVLMQVKQLMAGFDPDIAGQLEPIIGVSLASQLGLLIMALKGNVSQTAKHTFNDVADWANDVAGNAAPDPEIEAETNDLKQQLLKLRADVEREEARLNAIKAEQARLRNQ